MTKHDVKQHIKLSILVPSYNVEKYIEECLDSINKQITDDCELIIYDDASTDETLSIIKKHSITQINNFKLIIGLDNKGLSVARNNLKSLCSGDYIWFMDSDDIILDGSIKKTLQIINDYDVDIIFFNFIKWFELQTIEGNPAGKEIKTCSKQAGYYLTDKTTIFCEVLNNGNFQTPSKIYHKCLFIEGTEFPAGRIFEDITITPLLASLSKSFLYIDEPFYAYRQRSGSITSSMKPELEIEPLRSCNDLRRRYETIHGPLCKKTSKVIAYLAAKQTRAAIKGILKSDNKEKTSTLLNEVLFVFNETHKFTILYVMYISFTNG